MLGIIILQNKMNSQLFIYLVLKSKIQTYYKLVIMFKFLMKGINRYEEY